jgi:hypothetical protein
MLSSILKEHNAIHRRGVRPVVQSSSDLQKVQLHIFTVKGKKANGDLVDIQLSVNAYLLNYGPCIFYHIITDTPYKKGAWLDHPYMNLKMDYDSCNIMVADHIDDTPAIRKMIEDIVIPNVWQEYTKLGDTFSKDQIKSTLLDKTIDMNGYKDSFDFNPTYVKLKLRVHLLELENNQLALKLSTNIPMKENEDWSLHPFRYLKSKNLKSICGILNDTPAVRQIIDDLVNPNKFKLCTTYDIDYRAHLIENLSKFFVKPNSEMKTKSQVINDLISCLQTHWS